MREDRVGLTVEQVLVGRFAVFAYLITDPSSKEALLFDPGAEPKKILERVEHYNADVKWIVCSHTHPDHIGAVKRMKEVTGAAVGVHQDEASRLSRFSTSLLVRLMGGRPVPKPDFLLKEGDHLPLGRTSVRVLHTPGHSPGGICLRFEDHLLTGDTLFVGGVGRTDLPGASWDVLSRSLSEKILALPDSTRIWPGHHYGPSPSNLLGAERNKNSFLREIVSTKSV